MTKLVNPFKDLVSDFTNINNEINETAKLISNDFDSIFDFSNIKVPMNIIREEDNSWTIEVAVVGKTKEDIRVYTQLKGNETSLFIEVKAPEVKKDYKLQKIKMGQMKIELTLPATLDSTKIKPSVSNGLLTIKIPLTKGAQPTEFVIE